MLRYSARFARPLGDREIINHESLHENDSIITSVLDLAISIITSSENASQNGILQAELYLQRSTMARDYLSILKTKLDESKNFKVKNIIERYVGEVRGVLKELEEGLGREGEGGVWRMVRRAFRFGGGGGGERG